MMHTTERSRYFPFERLEAYRLSKVMLRFVRERQAQLRGLPGKGAEQINRAVWGTHTALCSGSACEGAEARRHFRMSLSEAVEMAGTLDGALEYRVLSESEYAFGRETLLRLCACLRGLANPRRR